MPSILFHELVGYKFSKKNPKYNTNNFFLGAMVPDAVNAYGFASKEKRWAAHLRDENLEKWQENIIEFYKKNKDKFEHTYLIGYVVHVLTDIFCDKIYQKNIYFDLLSKGKDYNSAYSYYEQSIRKFENSNIDEMWWKEVRNNIQNAEKIPINNISENMIDDWIDYVIHQYEERKYEKADYITMEFVNNVLEEIEKSILQCVL